MKNKILKKILVTLLSVMTIFSSVGTVSALENAPEIVVNKEGEISWNTVNGASKYEVCIDGACEIIEETSKNYADELKSVAGVREVTVTALDSSNNSISYAGATSVNIYELNLFYNPDEFSGVSGSGKYFDGETARIEAIPANDDITLKEWVFYENGEPSGPYSSYEYHFSFTPQDPMSWWPDLKINWRSYADENAVIDDWDKFDVLIKNDSEDYNPNNKNIVTYQMGYWSIDLNDDWSGENISTLNDYGISYDIYCNYSEHNNKLIQYLRTRGELENLTDHAWGDEQYDLSNTSWLLNDKVNSVPKQMEDFKTSDRPGMDEYPVFDIETNFSNNLTADFVEGDCLKFGWYLGSAWCDVCKWNNEWRSFDTQTNLFYIDDSREEFTYGAKVLNFGDEGFDLRDKDLYDWISNNATKIENIQDLAGTAWHFKNNIDVDSILNGYDRQEININFAARNSRDYYTGDFIFEKGNQLIFRKDQYDQRIMLYKGFNYGEGFYPNMEGQMEDNGLQVYYNGEWTPSMNSEYIYPFIKISGGASATDPDFVEWMKENAILASYVKPVEIDSLAGTSWCFYDDLSGFENLKDRYSLNFILLSNWSGSEEMEYDYFETMWGIQYGHEGIYELAWESMYKWMGSTMDPSNALRKSIYINDGWDAEDETLIEWFKNNAEFLGKSEPAGPGGDDEPEVEINLEGTTWKFNKEIKSLSSSHDKYVNDSSWSKSFDVSGQITGGMFDNMSWTYNNVWERNFTSLDFVKEEWSNNYRIKAGTNEGYVDIVGNGQTMLASKSYLWDLGNTYDIRIDNVNGDEKELTNWLLENATCISNPKYNNNSSTDNSLIDTEWKPKTDVIDLNDWATKNMPGTEYRDYNVSGTYIANECEYNFDYLYFYFDSMMNSYQITIYQNTADMNPGQNWWLYQSMGLSGSTLNSEVTKLSIKGGADAKDKELFDFFNIIADCTKGSIKKGSESESYLSLEGTKWRFNESITTWIDSVSDGVDKFYNIKGNLFYQDDYYYDQSTFEFDELEFVNDYNYGYYMGGPCWIMAGNSQYAMGQTIMSNGYLPDEYGYNSYYLNGRNYEIEFFDNQETLDCRDEELINWLIENAELIEGDYIKGGKSQGKVTSLKGTKWKFDASKPVISWPENQEGMDSSIIIPINGIYDGDDRACVGDGDGSFNAIRFDKRYDSMEGIWRYDVGALKDWDGMYEMYFYAMAFELVNSNTTYDHVISKDDSLINYCSWTENPTIEFGTDGDEEQYKNQELINWLYDNAILLNSQEQGEDDDTVYKSLTGTSWKLNTEDLPQIGNNPHNVSISGSSDYGNNIQYDVIGTIEGIYLDPRYADSTPWSIKTNFYKITEIWDWGNTAPSFQYSLMFNENETNITNGITAVVYDTWNGENKGDLSGEFIVSFVDDDTLKNFGESTTPYENKDLIKWFENNAELLSGDVEKDITQPIVNENLSGTEWHLNNEIISNIGEPGKEEWMQWGWTREYVISGSCYNNNDMTDMLFDRIQENFWYEDNGTYQHYQISLYNSETYEQKEILYFDGSINLNEFNRGYTSGDYVISIDSEQKKITADVSNPNLIQWFQTNAALQNGNIEKKTYLESGETGYSLFNTTWNVENVETWISSLPNISDFENITYYVNGYIIDEMMGGQYDFNSIEFKKENGYYTVSLIWQDFEMGWNNTWTLYSGSNLGDSMNVISYKFKITGGDDIDDYNLVEWFENNLTCVEGDVHQKITYSLEDTKWVFNNEIYPIYNEYGQIEWKEFYINGEFEYIDFEGNLTAKLFNKLIMGADGYGNYQIILNSTPLWQTYGDAYSDYYLVNSTYAPYNPVPGVLKFYTSDHFNTNMDGSSGVEGDNKDVTNKELLNWLKDNAELVEGEYIKSSNQEEKSIVGTWSLSDSFWNEIPNLAYRTTTAYNVRGWFVDGSGNTYNMGQLIFDLTDYMNQSIYTYTNWDTPEYYMTAPNEKVYIMQNGMGNGIQKLIFEKDEYDNNNEALYKWLEANATKE